MAITSNTTHIPTKQELSIQISLSGLSFCILQRDTKTITFLKDYDFERKLNPHELLDKVKHLFSTEPFLKSNFANVQVLHVNELSTFVPKPLFDETCLADYLKFNSKILKSDFIAFDAIEINDTVNVYVPYVNINNFIYDLFGSFTYKHISTILIEQVLAIEKNANNVKVYINVNKHHFEMVVIDKSKLILYNTFEYTTKEDFIYYILFAAEQLQLNPEMFELNFMGDIDSKDELYVMTYKYVQFVFFGKRQDHYKFNLSAQPKSDHSHFAILKSFV